MADEENTLYSVMCSKTLTMRRLMTSAVCSKHLTWHMLSGFPRPPLVTAIVMLCVAASLACAGAPAVDAAETNARIARIENDIITIDAAGADSGIAQSLLSRMASLKVPGLSVAVFDSGRIVWARGYGVVDQNTVAVVDTATLFQAASISKPVTSVGMFRLVEQGRLSLDENVNARLQSWAVPESRFTRIEKITPRRIVTHMSGLNVHGFLGYRSDDTLPTLQQVLNGEPPANSPPVRVDTIPGAREVYSGGGFVVLQLLMEEVSGQSFSALLADLVLTPAGMGHSTFAQPLPNELVGRAATGHDETGAPIAGRYHVHPELAAAGLWATPSDLAGFMLSVGQS